MKKTSLPARIVSVLLATAMLLGFAQPVGAVSASNTLHYQQVDNDAVSANLWTPVEENADEAAPYADTDLVRVSIVLEKAATLDVGFSTLAIAQNAAAMRYRQALQTEQMAVTASIEKAIEGQLDVAWNLTLAANLISANVSYGQIETIRKVPGVKTVVLEPQYDPAVVSREEIAQPNMATSSEMIGTPTAWAEGYTGAGARIAVIDTGIDTDHQSFSAAGLEYSLARNAEQAGVTTDAYLQSLNLLDAEEIAAKLELLNIGSTLQEKGYQAGDLYFGTKIGFGFNYVDKSLDITHDNDYMGEHGSHVEGIAAANAYIPQEDGTFQNAYETVKVRGVAPDAQLIVMKVFGKGGGAYAADYMAAIEDAILLGCDSVNLSLGSGNPGTSRYSGNETYAAIMENLVRSDTVVTMSAGNSGYWAQHTFHQGLYDDGVSFDEVGSPGSYTNSLAVASADNSGFIGAYVSVGEHMIFYTERDYVNRPISTIAGTHEYIFIDGVGAAADFAALGDVVRGKIMILSRGNTSYVDTHQNAEAAGAVGCIVYNNEPGISGMNLEGSTATIPCVSITQADGGLIRAASTPVTDDDLLYMTGSITVGENMGSIQYDTPYTMSVFSSWGVPGSLELKPDITAPGGSIYSVNGLTPGGRDYEMMSGTSMAAPQVAGMAALVAQYIRETGLEQQTGIGSRALAQSLLMSTARPMRDASNAYNYYPVLQQGAGLANVGAAIGADSYIMMAADTNAGAADGKIKAELGDDPLRQGVYTTAFSVNNLTDQEQSYTLSADLFTQDLFDLYQDGTNFLDTWTTPLLADVVWTVNGRTLQSEIELDAMDFNSDGAINSQDVQALLDYATGIRQEIGHKDNADLNQDGQINTYDAYLFLDRFNRGAMTIPANGQAEVHVTIRLTDAQKTELDECYPVGAYVEGFVYVNGLSSEEGVLGTTHSIPLLGFYGSWTESSMYDLGTYAEYLTGDETRYPYMGVTNSNALSILYGDDPDNAYLFGGNPVVPDETYMPERNAVNSIRGDAFHVWNCAAIRNASNSRYTITDENGNLLASQETGPVTAAYFSVNDGYWFNTSMSVGIGWKIADLAEGTRITAELTLAPEYYVDADGTTDWDALGEGATMTFPAVVDNTAPELIDVAYSMVNNALYVTASDNLYVAGVVLFDAGGSRALATCGAYADMAPGQEASYTLNMDGVGGRKFLLQVMDYARNVTTYTLETQIGQEAPLPHLVAYDTVVNQWIGFDTDTPYGAWETVALCEDIYQAATIVDNRVFAATGDGVLYVMEQDAMGVRTPVGNLGCILTDMAYNPADDTIYGVTDTNMLVSIDKLTCQVNSVGKIGVTTNTLACDDDGVFYCNQYRSGDIYSFTAETVSAPSFLMYTNIPDSQYLQSMEIDPNNGLLYWASYYMMNFWGNLIPQAYLLEIDTRQATFNSYQVISDQLTALIIPKQEGGSNWDAPTDTVSGIQISHASVGLLRGTTAELSAYVQPWTVTDRSVVWSSSDPAIATVDQNGVVTAVAPGQCTITAVSNLNPAYSASCTVTVDTMKVTLHGALQDAEGQPMFFHWNMDTDSTWTSGPAIETSINSMTYDTDNHQMFIMDAVTPDWRMHKVDLQTGKILETAANGMGVPLWDMAYSTYYSTAEAPRVSGIYAQYFMPVKDPLALDPNVIDMAGYLSRYTGASYFTAIASGGYAQYENGFTLYDTEVFYLLDNAGYIWALYVYELGGGSYSAYMQYYPTDLTDLRFPGYLDNMYCSMVAGTDGALYLSCFTGSTNAFYRLAYSAESGIYESTAFGNVGEDVWPALLYRVEANGAGQNADALPQPTLHLEAAAVSAQELTAASANLDVARICRADASQPLPASVPETSHDEKSVTLTVTTSVAATNGLTTVSYDTSRLALESAVVNGDYTAKLEEDGKLTFGYVSLTEIPAEGTIATLTFQVLEAVESTVTVEHRQVNNTAGSTEDLQIEFEHANTEIRDAVEATCTTAGYTGDTYCTDCGQLVKKGEIIQAKGHSFGEWTVTRAATCTEKGEEIRTCEVCGATETRETDMIAHNYEKVIVAPTCTEQGYTTYTCHCGDTYVDDYVDALGHTFGDWTVTEQETCTKAGMETRTCEVCGETETREIPPYCPAEAYTDVNTNLWYHEGVCYVIRKGLMEGKDVGIFAPEVNLSRAELVTVLYRMAGEPSVEGKTHPFKDVSADAWYAEAVTWAFNEEVVKGMSTTAFAPGRDISREQIALILFRYSGAEKVEENALKAYTDASSVSYDAVDAMNWAVATGLIKGTTDTTLAPRATAIRAQIAMILMRYCEN